MVLHCVPETPENKVSCLKPVVQYLHSWTDWTIHNTKHSTEHLQFTCRLNLYEAVEVSEQYFIRLLVPWCFVLSSVTLKVWNSFNRSRHDWCHILATVTEFSPPCQAVFLTTTLLTDRHLETFLNFPFRAIMVCCFKYQPTNALTFSQIHNKTQYVSDGPTTFETCSNLLCFLNTLLWICDNLSTFIFWY